MNQFSVMNLRENQILAGASMGNVVGGYDLPEVVVIGHKHTGDPSTCKHCGPKLPGTDNWGMDKAIETAILWIRCWLKS